MKRLIVCSDGTWNSADQRHPTNVIKMALAISPVAPDGANQLVYYDPGVGTGNVLDRLSGGAFGGGLEHNIEDAYRFLMNNYSPGDEVFLFGFSRGAYTVRSTAGLIRKCGLLKKINANLFPEAYRLYRRRDPDPDMPDVLDFRNNFSHSAEIRFIGVWDTVGALGIPLRGLRWISKGRHEFHDTRLSKVVKNAYHALAIDERRGPFQPALWTSPAKPGQHVEQVWFTGSHSNVGGGAGRDTGLSDLAFMWMIEKGEDCGLDFSMDYIDKFIHPNENGRLQNSMKGLYRLTRGASRELGKLKNGQPCHANEAVHPDAADRYNGNDGYKPNNLTKYLTGPSALLAKVRRRW